MIPHIPHHRRSGIGGRGRFVRVLIILMVAGGIALWAVQREARRMTEVKQMVLTLCHDAGAGKDISKSMATESTALAAIVADRVRQTCPTPELAAGIDVRVTSGDTSGTMAGSRAAGSATHTAMIVMGDVELLGLRLVHTGDPNRIVILGSFDPDVPGRAGP